MNTKFDFFVGLGDFVHALSKVHGLLDDVLVYDLEDLIPLEGLTRDVERETVGTNSTLEEVEALGNDVLAVVHGEDAADVEPYANALLLGFEEIEGNP